MSKKDIDTASKLRKSNPTALLAWTIIVFVLGILGIQKGGAVFILLALFLGWRWWSAQKLYKAAPAELVEQVQRERAELNKARISKSAVKVRFTAGLDEMHLSGVYELAATESALLLRKGQSRIELPWLSLESIEAGTEDELRSRLTLTRVALVGIFALGAKKEKKQDFYLTINTKDSVGLFDLEDSGKNKQLLALTKAFAVSCNAKIKSARAKSQEQ